jgi:hypothetical protein
MRINNYLCWLLVSACIVRCDARFVQGYCRYALRLLLLLFAQTHYTQHSVAYASNTIADR